MPFLLTVAAFLLQALTTLQEVDPDIPVEDPIWWPRTSWLLLAGIALAVLIAFIVWVMRNPPGSGERDMPGAREQNAPGG